MSFRKIGGGVGVCIMAVTASATAHGQDSRVQAGTTAIEPIVVTAQRREENLQDVPISITTRTGDELEKSGVSSVLDLEAVTPGLNMGRVGASNVGPSLRGVSSQSPGPGNDANVAIYLDGVYQASPQGNIFDLPDVERIEVAKGPQGTLFGRNATGGAIQIFTRPASFTTSGKLTLGYSRFKDLVAKGFLTGPIAGDTLAASFSAVHERKDGYITNLYDGNDKAGYIRSTVLRGKLLFRPTNNLEFRLTLAYLDRLDKESEALAALNGNSVGRFVPGAIIADSPSTTATETSLINHIKTYAANLRIQLSLDAGTLTSLSSYNKVKANGTVDGDFSTAALATYHALNPDTTYQQELTFASNPFGAFSVIGGIFLYHQKAEYQPLDVSGFEIWSHQDTFAYAGFGEVNVEITPRLTAIAGIRYSEEKRKLYGSYGEPSQPKLGEKKFSSWTPRASLRYNIADDTNIYFTYSQGFKSGAFSTTALFNPAVPSEKLKAYELGIKSQPISSIRANAAVFYYDYSNLQIPYLALDEGSGIGIAQSAPVARIYGLDADITARVTPEFQFSAGLSVLDPKYKKFPTALVNVPTLIDGVVCNCGNTQATVDATGNNLALSPKWTLNVTLDYTKEFSAGTLNLNALMFHTDTIYYTPDERIKQDPYTTFNARASFAPAGTGFKFNVWGRNLTNKRYFSMTFVGLTGDGVQWAAPRSYGVSVDVSF